MKYYILFGPPGAGKGTHAAPMTKDYNLCHLSTGELLRAEIQKGTELGKKAKALIDDGNLVPDEIVEGMIAEKFASTTGVDGFILDGFPRTVAQAEDLDRMLSGRGESVTALIALMVDDDVIHRRIRHRAEVEGRADDASDEIISNRIRTYHEKTEPLIDYYRKQGKYHEINGYGGEGPEGIATVYDRIRNLMKEI